MSTLSITVDWEDVDRGPNRFYDLIGKEVTAKLGHEWWEMVTARPLRVDDSNPERLAIEFIVEAQEFRDRLVERIRELESVIAGFLDRDAQEDEDALRWVLDHPLGRISPEERQAMDDHAAEQNERAQRGEAC